MFVLRILCLAISSVFILSAFPQTSFPAMPQPAGTQYHSYPAAAFASSDDDPAKAKPIGVGTVAAGANTVRLEIEVAYAAPVDLYFAIYAPGPLQSNDFFLLNSNFALTPFSQSGLVPWKLNVTQVNEGIFGYLSAADLPGGTYTFYLLALPGGTSPALLNDVHLWSTDLTVSHLPPGPIPSQTPGYKELGCGTDVFGEYASENNVKGRVLNIDALNADTYLTLNENVQESVIEQVSGSNVSEYAEALGLTVGLSGSYKWFSASIQSAFTDSTYKREEYSYVTLMERHFKNSLKILNEKWSASYLKNYLTVDAGWAINNTDPYRVWTPQEVIATFGTHVMVGIYTGARLDYSLSIKLTDVSYRSQLQVYAEAKAHTIFASASFYSGLDMSTFNAMSAFEQRQTTRCKGGLEQYARPADDDDYKLWKASIDEYPALVGIIQNALVPIWEFADGWDQAGGVCDPGSRCELIRIAYIKYANEQEPKFDPILKLINHFNAGPEGWSPFEAGGFNWYNNGNNQATFGGHLEATDGSRSPWYFKAAAGYGGDRHLLYGGQLSYHFRWWANEVSHCDFRGKNQSGYDAKYGAWWKPDVEIEGSNGAKLGYFFPPDQAPDAYNGGLLRYDRWLTYAVPISETTTTTAPGYGWIKYCDTPPCFESGTEADFKNVLKHVNRIMIRGEYCFGSADRGLLDEVIMQASDTDNDGIFDLIDNCPDDYNPDQQDSNNDGTGDVCENKS